MAGPIENDARVMAVAGRRAGICRHGDLIAIGLSEGAIDRRRQQGLLQTVARGVYVVAELTEMATPLFRATVAFDESTLSHVTAGALDEFPVESEDFGVRVEVIVPEHCGRRLPGVTVHRRRRPPIGSDVQTINGLPVTAPARTIVDLASVVGPSRLRHIVETQVGRGRPTRDELIACFDSVARQGVNGIGQLRRLLGELFDVDAVSGSVLESAVANLLRAGGITGFVSQYRPPWYDGRRGVVDFAHPELQLILEADGRGWHHRDQEMTEDRRRDRVAVGHGWATIRVTWAEVSQRPAATSQELMAAIHARAALLHPAS